MRGLPSNIDLAPLTGAELIQLCIGQSQVQFHFSNGTRLAVESTVVVGEGGSEKTVDEYPAGAALLSSFVGCTAAKAIRADDGGLEIAFTDGRRLHATNDAREYESFQLHIGGNSYIA